MKKETIVGLIVIMAIALVAIFAGCIDNDDDSSSSTPTPTFTPSVTPAPTPNGIFTLKEWEVKDDNRRAVLVLRFDLKEDAKMYLLTPEGDLVTPKGYHTYPWGSITITELAEYKTVIKEMKTVRLPMTRFERQIPQTGTWTLVVRTMADEPDFTKDFTFKGPELELVNQDWEWEIKKSKLVPRYLGHYKVYYRLSIKNRGDLPIYLDDVEAYVDGGKYRCEDMGENIWEFIPNEPAGPLIVPYKGISPNETIVDDGGILGYISYIPVDGKKHEITLRHIDENGNIALTTSTTIPK